MLSQHDPCAVPSLLVLIALLLREVFILIITLVHPCSDFYFIVHLPISLLPLPSTSPPLTQTQKLYACTRFLCDEIHDVIRNHPVELDPTSSLETERLRQQIGYVWAARLLYVGMTTPALHTFMRQVQICGSVNITPFSFECHMCCVPCVHSCVCVYIHM